MQETPPGNESNCQIAHFARLKSMTRNYLYTNNGMKINEDIDKRSGLKMN
jgi:hypothetical protein